MLTKTISGGIGAFFSAAAEYCKLSIKIGKIVRQIDKECYYYSRDIKEEFLGKHLQPVESSIHNPHYSPAGMREVRLFLTTITEHKGYLYKPHIIELIDSYPAQEKKLIMRKIKNTNPGLYCSIVGKENVIDEKVIKTRYSSR